MNSDLVESIWILKPVAELVDIYIGGTPSRRVDEYWGSDVKWASAADVAACNTRYMRDTTERISIIGLENSSAKLLEEDTVLITARGTVGALCMLPEPMAFNQTCYGLVSKGEIDPTFLYFALKARIAHVKAQTYGAVFDTITTRSFNNILIPVPPIEIQQRIASILSNYDDLIENNRRRIAILEEMARAIYREWFVHFRFPGHEEVEMVDSEQGEIPKDWELIPISGILALDRKNVNPSKYKDETFSHFSFPAHDDKKLPVLQRGGEIRSNKYQVGDDFVLLSKLNPRFPRVWLPFLNRKYRAIASTDFLTLIPKTTQSSFFLYCFLSSQEFHQKFAALTIGTSTSHQRVKPDDFLAMKIPSVPKNLTEMFTKIVEPMLLLQQNLRESNHQLAQIRNTLLPGLVSGQIDVSDLRIEIPTDARQKPKYSDQSILEQWLDGDDDDV